MSAHTTRAPSEAKRRAVARPMPLPAPVMTAVRPTRRRHTGVSVTLSLTSLLLGADEHVLGLGVGGQGVGAQLPAETGLLVAAERGRVAHAAVRVDGQVPG